MSAADVARAWVLRLRTGPDPRQVRYLTRANLAWVVRHRAFTPWYLVRYARLARTIAHHMVQRPADEEEEQQRNGSVEIGVMPGLHRFINGDRTGQDQRQ